ncbi:hypothetical protein ACYCFC_12170 [Stutzerimonas sp. NM35]
MEFNKAVLDCMRMLRRRLREEQHLDIRLSQPDAISAMLAACLCSSDELTRDLGKQLATYRDQPLPVLPISASPADEVRQASIRIYRGQRIIN